MHKIICRILTAALMLISIQTSAYAKPDACPDVAAAWSGVYCAGETNGVALAGTADRAKQLLGYAAGSQAQFEKLFGRPAVRFAIIEISTGSLSEDRRIALRKAGFAVVLPWLSAEAYQSQIEASIRQTVEARLIKSGMPEGARQAAMTSAMAQAISQISPEASARRDSTAIPHELGHMWLIHAFWPDNNAGGAGHYGGPGPDWLDEMAGVLMEPEHSAKRRTEQFTERYRAIRLAMRKGDKPSDPLLDLNGYFPIAHPAADAARELMLKDGGNAKQQGISVKVLSGAEAERFAGDGIRFYLQSLLVSEYLIARSGDPKVIGQIAGAAAGGQSFTDWLSTIKKKNSLPVSVDAMQADWINWLEQRFPDPVV